MKLPRDPNDWHEGHFEAAVREVENALRRYEDRVGTVPQEVSDRFYADYQKKVDRLVNIRIVVKGA